MTLASSSVGPFWNVQLSVHEASSPFKRGPKSASLLADGYVNYVERRDRENHSGNGKHDERALRAAVERRESQRIYADCQRGHPGHARSRQPVGVVAYGDSDYLRRNKQLGRTVGKFDAEVKQVLDDIIRELWYDGPTED